MGELGQGCGVNSLGDVDFAVEAILFFSEEVEGYGLLVAQMQKLASLVFECLDPVWRLVRSIF